MLRQIGAEAIKSVKNNWPVICIALLVPAVLFTLAMWRINSRENNLTAQINSMAIKFENNVAMIKEELDDRFVSMTLKHDSELDGLKMQIKELRERSDVLNKTLVSTQELLWEVNDAIGSKVAQLEKQMNLSDSALLTHLTATTEELKALNKTVSDMHKEVAVNFSTTKKEISFIKDTLVELQNKSAANFSALVTQNMEIQNSLNTASNNIQLLSTGLQELKVETHTNISIVSKSSSHSIQQLEQQLASNASHLSEAWGEIKRLQTYTSKAEEDIRGEVSKVTDRVAQLEDAKTNLAESITNHDNQIKEVESKLQSTSKLTGDHDNRLAMVEHAQASQRSTDDSQDQKIISLHNKLNDLASSAHQLTSFTVTIMTVCVLFVLCVLF